MKDLFKVKGAWPFLIALFINAFIDLGHKIVVQNTIFKIYDGPEQVVLTAIVNALILLPFILLFSPAGFTSDKYPKSQVMRLSAWAAVGITAGITLFYALGWFWAAFAMTFLMAVQSAFFSPAKYGYIKNLFGKQKLAQANGLVQSLSIISILVGTFVYSIAFEALYDADALSEGEVIAKLIPIGLLLVINSVLELIMLYRLPQLEEQEHREPFDVKAYLRGKLALENIKPLLVQPALRQCMVGLALFWSVGQVMLAAFPAFAKASLGETNTVVIQAILASSGIGIALGAALGGKVSRNYIETGLIPVGAIGFAIGLCFLPGQASVGWMVANFLWIGFMGGLFIVPLNALIQFNAREGELGQVLATNNFVQNISMLLFLGITVAFSLLALSPKFLLALIAAVAIAGSFYTIYRLPQSLVRLLFGWIVKNRYRVNVQGMKNIPEEGGVLLLGNHISWVDWAIVQIACPRPVRFVMHQKIYELWYLNWFLKLFGCIPISAGVGSQKSLEDVAELLNNGEVVCLFPEGMLSRNGHLAEFRQGYERATALCDESVVILPFYLRGLWGSQFSNSSENFKRVRRPGSTRRDIIVAFGQPMAKETETSVLKRRVFDLSISSWQEYSKSLPNLAHGWIDRVKQQGSKLAIADTMGQPLSAHRALAGAIAFSQRIGLVSPEQNIGLLLPSSAGGVLANMAVLLQGKTVVNLNYTASKEAFVSSVAQAGIKTVYTSKRFLKKLTGRGMDCESLLVDCNIVYLEDVRQTFSKTWMLTLLLCVKLLPACLLKALFARTVDPQSTAAILFSSGSEGLPKGIQLSHTNIMGNLKQVSDVLNTREDDVVMASLPPFHAFGLTVTQFMPLIEGIPVVCHADPTDPVATAKAIANYKATILCGTSTFLRLYCRNKKVHPLMLNSLRVIVSGAEKLNPLVRTAFKEKFNKEIYEGYGTTETTPVASVNIPDVLSTDDWKVQVGDRRGTVGMPLPGTSFKVVDPDSFEELPTGEDGMVLIGGTQVMQGYLDNPEKTAEVIREIEGIRWYVTGDKGHLDADGFLTLVDRYSRFAKLGGEMISLSAIEGKVLDALRHAGKVDDDFEVVAVNLPDDKKGEKVVLLVADLSLTLSELKEALLACDTNPLMIPAVVCPVPELPKLGSGKVDFSAAKRLAAQSNQA